MVNVPSDTFNTATTHSVILLLIVITVALRSGYDISRNGDSMTEADLIPRIGAFAMSSILALAIVWDLSVRYSLVNA